MPQRELELRSQEMRAAGLDLVLTNGCFDLLHLGHVRYLEDARALGDALAVAVNSDASVRRLKGTGRPIVPERDRAEIVAGLRAVDLVVIFDDDTAARLVRAVRPAVYVKGGDYSSDPESERFPPEGRTVLEYGGTVTVVPHVQGRSTSETVRRLGTHPGRPGSQQSSGGTEPV